MPQNTLNKIYLDYAATTPVSEEVLNAMTPYFSQKYGNPSELHSWGVEAKLGLEEARQTIASYFGAKEKEIIFTSCATESINLSHKGLIEALRTKLPEKKFHIITSSVEHKAVLETCKHLEKLGWAEITYLQVDEFGMVSLEEMQKAIKEETVLVSVMYVNNEVGTIQPIPEIGQVIEKINLKRTETGKQRIYFHTDATQAVQSQNCDVNFLKVDLLSFTGHKFYAPKGIGALYVREGTPLLREQDGGGQERNFRAGTENVPYIIALGKAIEKVRQEKEQENKRLSLLREKLIEGILNISGTSLTGHPTNRAPHIASFIIESIEGESLLLLLNEEQIAVSTGSACTTGNLSPSHVLTAMGIPSEKSHGSIRFSLGKWTKEEDITFVLTVLPKVIEKLRGMAPKLEAGMVI